MLRKAAKAEAGLLNKGFRPTETHHHRFIYYSKAGKKSPINTKSSHNGQDLDDYLLGAMAKQTRLDRDEFIDLIDCPMSRDAYEGKLVTLGVIAASPWSAPGQAKAANITAFLKLTATEVFSQDEVKPTEFVASTALGTMLFKLTDQQAGRRRFAAALINEHTLAALKANTLTVRKALDQTTVWFVDLQDDDTPLAAWRGTLADAPIDAGGAPF